MFKKKVLRRFTENSHLHCNSEKLLYKYCDFTLKYLDCNFTSDFCNKILLQYCEIANMFKKQCCVALQKIHICILIPKNYFTSIVILLYNTSTVILHQIFGNKIPLKYSEIANMFKKKCCVALQKIHICIVIPKIYFTSIVILLYNNSTVILHQILVIKFH